MRDTEMLVYLNTLTSSISTGLAFKKKTGSSPMQNWDCSHIYKVNRLHFFAKEAEESIQFFVRLPSNYFSFDKGVLLFLATPTVHATPIGRQGTEPNLLTVHVSFCFLHHYSSNRVCESTFFLNDITSIVPQK